MLLFNRTIQKSIELRVFRKKIHVKVFFSVYLLMHIEREKFPLQDQNFQEFWENKFKVMK